MFYLQNDVYNLRQLLSATNSAHREAETSRQKVMELVNRLFADSAIDIDTYTEISNLMNLEAVSARSASRYVMEMTRISKLFAERQRDIDSSIDNMRSGRNLSKLIKERIRIIPNHSGFSYYLPFRLRVKGSIYREKFYEAQPEYHIDENLLLEFAVGARCVHQIRLVTMELEVLEFQHQKDEQLCVGDISFPRDTNIGHLIDFRDELQRSLEYINLDSAYGIDRVAESPEKYPEVCEQLLDFNNIYNSGVFADAPTDTFWCTTRCYRCENLTVEQCIICGDYVCDSCTSYAMDSNCDRVRICDECRESSSEVRTCPHCGVLQIENTTNACHHCGGYLDTPPEYSCSECGATLRRSQVNYILDNHEDVVICSYCLQEGLRDGDLLQCNNCNAIQVDRSSVTDHAECDNCGEPLATDDDNYYEEFDLDTRADREELANE